MVEYRPIHINASYDLNTIRYPITAYFKVTTRCMLKCTFCSQSDEVKRDMDFDFAKQQMLYFYKMGIKYIYITGGEPLLYPLIIELLKYGYSIGLKLVLITNGISLFENNLEECLKYIVAIGISLHGITNIHNKLSGNIECHDVVIDTLSKISENYPYLKIDINCTVVPDNMTYENFMYLCHFAESINAYLCFGRLNYVGGGKKYEQEKDINNFLRLVDSLDYPLIKVSNCIVPCIVEKKYHYLLHSCGAGITTVALEPNGDVKICPTSQIAIDNLYKSSFKKIWKSKKMKEFRNLKWLPLTCKTCKEFPLCKAGCHSELDQLFWKHCCDQLYWYKYNETWERISKNYLRLRCSEVRKEGNGYILLSFPSKKINKKVYHIFRKLDGTYTGDQILKSVANDVQIKDLLITLMLDNLIEVKNETSKNI